MKKLRSLYDMAENGERIEEEDIIRRAENIIHVRHQNLERADEESIHRSKCPSCKNGVLLMRRNLQTGNLLVTDLCIGCGQAVEYTDMVPGLTYLKYKEE